MVFRLSCDYWGYVMSYESKLLFVELSRHVSETPRISLKNLSSKMNVSRRTIEKTIKLVAGKTFREFQGELFMARVQFLLTSQATLSIKTLSFDTGYKSARSFSRSVKRMSGLCPHELRSRLAQIEQPTGRSV